MKLTGALLGQENITGGKDAGDFRGYISYNSGATLASTTRGWVIKKVNTKLPSGKINQQLKKDNFTLNTSTTEWIISRGNKPSTTRSKRYQEPEQFIMKSDAVVAMSEVVPHPC